ncbi:MAG: GGDEF domain-containing protein [Ruminococcus sp.]|nr:GGDEF domain-containing protein [Ruminococcus sp.]
MIDPLTYVKQIFNTGEQITNRIKYSFLQWGCAFVHFTLIFIFAACRITPMMIFNIVSTAVYVACNILIRKEKYVLFYYITFAEICIHSYTAVILTGWSSGFALYIVSVTPMVFYMHFSLSEGHTLKESMTVGICAALVFITCKIISDKTEHPYPISINAAEYIYIYNSLITFIMLLFFSLVFLREMQYSHAALEEQNERLDKMAGVDALTGLYNRRSMSKFLDAAVMSGKTYSLIMCDIDDFKKVNDTYGHDAGDVVLKSVSAALTESLRDGDYVCRWGGEEILILATGTTLEAAAQVAERLRRVVDEMPVSHNSVSIHCTITVSAADSTEAALPADIITLADSRLYVGKRGGKNCVVIKN